MGAVGGGAFLFKNHGAIPTYERTWKRPRRVRKHLASCGEGSQVKSRKSKGVRLPLKLLGAQRLHSRKQTCPRMPRCHPKNLGSWLQPKKSGLLRDIIKKKKKKKLRGLPGLLGMWGFGNLWTCALKDYLGQWTMPSGVWKVTHADKETRNFSEAVLLGQRMCTGYLLLVRV